MERFEDYYSRLKEAIDNIDEKQFSKVLSHLRFAKENKNSIYIIGNGGSIDTANHWANDIAKFAKLGTHPLTNLSTITAIGNDLSYDKVFSEQLEVHMKTGDLLIVITGSGNSKNILEALNYAKSRGNPCVGILGFDGGKAKGLCDAYVLIESRDYGIIEDLHLSLGHLFSRNLE